MKESPYKTEEIVAGRLWRINYSVARGVKGAKIFGFDPSDPGEIWVEGVRVVIGGVVVLQFCY